MAALPHALTLHVTGCRLLSSGVSARPFAARARDRARVAPLGLARHVLVCGFLCSFRRIRPLAGKLDRAASSTILYDVFSEKFLLERCFESEIHLRRWKDRIHDKPNCRASGAACIGITI